MGVNFNVTSTTKDQRSQFVLAEDMLIFQNVKKKNYTHTLTYTHRKYTELANI